MPPVVGAIGKYFGGVSTAAISKTVARLEHRGEEDRGWDTRLGQFARRLIAAGGGSQELQVKTCPQLFPKCSNSHKSFPDRELSQKRCRVLPPNRRNDVCCS